MRPPPPPVRRAFAWAALRLSALFAITFYGADALATWRGAAWRVHAAWELAIAYWPAMWPVYFSVLLVPFLPLLLAPDAAAVRRWERSMAWCVAAAGAVFVAFPTAPGYAAADPGPWWPLAWLARQVSGRHNLLPSLHVALSVVTMRAAWPWSGPALRGALAAWLAALVASVLLTHQHHVADIVAGVMLALLVRRAS